MTTLTETRHAGGFLACGDWEPGESHEPATVLSGQSLLTGEVCGKITKTLAAAPNPSVSGTGNGTMTNVRPNAYVQTGNYVVKCTAIATNGGTFSVTAPDGTALPDLVLTAGAGTATNYSSTHLDFTVTDGSTDFAVNDTFTIAVTAGGTPAVVGTGNGTISAISLGKQAINGTYRIVCTAAVTNGGTFSVTAPDGDRLPDLVLTASAGAATAYTSDHINFTLTDGSTDFAVGAYFHVVVARGSNKVKTWNPAATDGSQVVAGILFDEVNASTGDKPGVLVVRDCAVNASELAWGSSVSAADKLVGIEQIKALTINVL